MLTHTLKSFGSNGFQQLTRNCQVILADCLDRGTPEVLLSDSDLNADLLCRTGWLVEQCNMVAKARSFAVPYERWAQLTAMKAQLLTPAMHADITRYRSVKPDFFKRTI
jgi:hypothetical protein